MKSTFEVGDKIKKVTSGNTGVVGPRGVYYNSDHHCEYLDVIWDSTSMNGGYYPNDFEMVQLSRRYAVMCIDHPLTWDEASDRALNWANRGSGESIKIIEIVADVVPNNVPKYEVKKR